MSDSRDHVLEAIRAALGRGPLDGGSRRELEERLERPRANLIPARARLGMEGRLSLFARMAEEASATVARVRRLDDAREAVKDYLKRQNLPARVVVAPEPSLDDLARDPMLEVRRGPAEDSDLVSVTGAFAGIAETGTLMLVSGSENPTTLAFLPETHIVVLRAAQVVASYEDGWARLRESIPGSGGRPFPRAVSFVTGPSRSADIEQTLQMGAHGPRRLHVILVDGA